MLICQIDSEFGKRVVIICIIAIEFSINAINNKSGGNSLKIVNNIITEDLW